MQNQNKRSIAVIGAGVVGICTAIELQSNGYQVTLLDKGEAARQTSYGNASYIAAEFLGPLATPENILSAIKLTFSEKAAFKITPPHFLAFLPWSLRFLKQASNSNIGHNRSATVQLNKHAVEAWKEILKRSGHSNLLLNSGFLKLWENPKHLRQTKQAQQQFANFAFESALLQGDELFALEPALSRNISHALYFESACQLREPFQTASKLFKYFCSHGGKFIRAEVTVIKPQNEAVKLQTTNGEHYFSKAIIATGAWSKQLLKPLGLSMPLAAERGYHLTLAEPAVRPTHILESVDRHVVMSSLDSGLRITGFGEYANLDDKPIEKRYQQLTRHCQALIRNTDLAQQQTTTWMGIRPTLPDSLPVIDLHPQYPQIGMVFGHHHLGVTQAPISAKLIAAMISGDSDSDLLKEFGSHLSDYAVTRF